MSISVVITDGFGSFGTTAYVITSGYHSNTGASFSGIVACSQSVDLISIAILEAFGGSLSPSQATDVANIIVSETFASAIATLQGSDHILISAILANVGVISVAELSDQIALAGGLSFAALATLIQGLDRAAIAAIAQIIAQSVYNPLRKLNSFAVRSIKSGALRVIATKANRLV